MYMYTCMYIHVCALYISLHFSAFSQYNMEQFTPAKVNDDMVTIHICMYMYIHVPVVVYFLY